MPDDNKRYVTTLRPDLIKAISQEARVGLSLVPNTELQAGYALGVQRVLDILRDGFENPR